MNRTILSSLVAATVLTSIPLSGVATAGERTPDPVVVHVKERWATGGLGGARNSADNRQVILCSMAAWPRADGTSGTYLNCFARTSTGVDGFCNLDDPDLAMIATLGTITADSHIKFVWDTSNRCTALYIVNSSALEPKY